MHLQHLCFGDILPISVILLPPVLAVIIRIACHPDAGQHEGRQEDSSGKDQGPHYRHLHRMISVQIIKKAAASVL